MRRKNVSGAQLNRVKRRLTKLIQSPSIKRHKHNPILSPNPDNFWETKATFNPAALYEDGKVHLIYRAIGETDTSVLGYATSADGITIDLRHGEPMLVPRAAFEGSFPKYNMGPRSTGSFMSGGGGYGGCEDPRITKIGDMIHLTYVAYDGWSPPRVALTSIGTGDFLAHNWGAWSEPVLISRPGEVNKNACILPEKINGKYVIFHRVYPDILIDYVDDLNFDGKTKWLETKRKISPRKTFWDSRKVGIGATPIKTDRGWLLIYQAVGNQDPSRYKIGAMLLDSKNPARVIARSKKPILEPTEDYENGGWKYGVVYPCGAVTMNKDLFVYYGGSDMVTCVATANLNTFLNELTSTEEPRITRKIVTSSPAYVTN
jgi:predicted GH43/DUF377 family glycosyl hydrolase